MKNGAELIIDHGKEREDIDPEDEEVDISLKKNVQLEGESSYISSGAAEIPVSFDNAKKDVNREVEEGKEEKEEIETEETEDEEEIEQDEPNVEDTFESLQAKIGDYPLPTQKVGVMTPPEPPATELDDDDLKDDNSTDSKGNEFGDMGIIDE